MNSYSLKRHPSLRLFARDHGNALVCAQKMRKAARAPRTERSALLSQMRSRFDELSSSILEQQRVLAPIVARTGYAHRFHKHHNRTRNLISRIDKLNQSQVPGLGLLSMLGNALDEYVRWEENVLFPHIEKMLNAEELALLQERTHKIEAARPPSAQLA